MTRLAWWIALLCFAGCAGKLNNKEAFLEAGPLDGGANGDGTSNDCALTNIQTELVDQRCSTAGCHYAEAYGTAVGGGLALVDEEIDGKTLAQRVVDVESPACSGKKFVDSTNLSESYILEKLHPSPACGSVMPQVPPVLTEDEIICMEAWAQSLTESP